MGERDEGGWANNLVFMLILVVIVVLRMMWLRRVAMKRMAAYEEMRLKVLTGARSAFGLPAPADFQEWGFVKKVVPRLGFLDYKRIRSS